MSRVRLPAEVAAYDRNGEVVGWAPCTVEFGIDEDRIPPVYAVSVSTVVEKRVEEQADELASMRERVGRIAARLENVTAELRLLSEGLTSEESARTLERIETALGIEP